MSDNEKYMVNHGGENRYATDEEMAWSKELEDRYAKTEYIEKRQFEYGSIGEQLDMIYWDKVNGTEKWKEMVDKVKADNPKPE